MALAPPAPALRPAEAPIERFDRTERIVHWVTATLFATLMLTGAALYAGPISTLVGQRDLMRDVHVVAGLALPVPLVIGFVGRWGASLRRDLRRLDRWVPDDRVWLRGRTRGTAKLGKFNPGQKLNATFLGVTGAIHPFRVIGVAPYGEIGIGKLSYSDDAISTDDGSPASVYGLGVVIAGEGRLGVDVSLRLVRQTSLTVEGITSDFKYDPKVFSVLLSLKL